MTFSIDLFQLVAFIGIVLMMVGAIGFTPVSVGVLLILSMCQCKLTWARR